MRRAKQVRDVDLLAEEAAETARVMGAQGHGRGTGSGQGEGGHAVQGAMSGGRDVSD